MLREQHTEIRDSLVRLVNHPLRCDATQISSLRLDIIAVAFRASELLIKTCPVRASTFVLRTKIDVQLTNLIDVLEDQYLNMSGRVLTR